MNGLSLVLLEIRRLGATCYCRSQILGVVEARLRAASAALRNPFLGATLSSSRLDLTPYVRTLRMQDVS